MDQSDAKPHSARDGGDSNDAEPADAIDPLLADADEPAGSLDDALLSEPELGGFQFRLIGLFGLVTAAGMYFALERMHHGQFALNFLGGVALLVGVVIPVACFVIWMLGVFVEGISIARALAAIAILGAVLWGVRQIWG